MKLQIFDPDNWREIWATLGRNRTRTFLTAFGIFWGTAMLTLLWGGSQGLQDILRLNFKGISTNSAALWPNTTTIPYHGYKKGRSWNLNGTDIASIRHAMADDIKVSSCYYSTNATAKHADKTYTSVIQGVDCDYATITGPGLVDGRHLNANDMRLNRKVAVIGKRVAAELFGDESPIGQFVEVDNVHYNIVGTYTQVNQMRINRDVDECITIPSSTMSRVYNLGNNIDAFMLVPADGLKPSDLKKRIEHILFSHNHISPDDTSALEFIDVSETFETIDSLFSAVDILALFVGIGTLLAGIIGVGNIMWIIVKERTNEIGIRRAIGARPIDIIVQVLSESMVLTVIAGMAGIVFAVLILGAATQLTSTDGDIVRFQISFANALLTLVSFIILGTAAGSIPALKAMRIKPIEALNNK